LVLLLLPSSSPPPQSPPTCAVTVIVVVVTTAVHLPIVIVFFVPFVVLLEFRPRFLAVQPFQASSILKTVFKGIGRLPPRTNTVVVRHFQAFNGLLQRPYAPLAAHPIHDHLLLAIVVVFFALLTSSSSSSSSMLLLRHRCGQSLVAHRSVSDGHHLRRYRRRRFSGC
jgi:hypothetical protein